MTTSSAAGVHLVGRPPLAAPPGRADPLRLMRTWAPGRSSWFSGPRGGLLAEGTSTVLPADTASSPDAVAAYLDAVAVEGSAPAVVVGAIPFDSSAGAAGPDAAPHLVVPESIEWAPPLGAVLTTDPPHAPVVGSLRPGPGPAGYEAMVVDALARMGRGELEKVVLARTLDLVADAPVDPRPMLRELARRDPRGYLFAVTLPDATPGSGTPRTLLGASPELLLSRRGRKVVANPLAGSAARSDDPAEDRRRGEALLASAKDRHEHALVVRDVVAGLSPRCRDLDVPEEPSLVRTATLWHLSTTVRGEVAEPVVGALHLATALHPTPAVCGVPRDAARRAIAEIEPFDRGFYTGMVGWTDVHGDGEWVVALRCGDVQDRGVRLFAGAGIVPASEPTEELAETAVKLRTLLGALGLDGA